MSDLGQKFCDKIKELRPDWGKNVTPNMLKKVGEKPDVQEFLQWFCDNVTTANVLSAEEICIWEKIDKSGKELKGTELNDALEKAAIDHPEILSTLKNFDTYDLQSNLLQLDKEKKNYDQNKQYCDALQESLNKLKIIESRMDEELRTQKDCFDKTNIESEELFNKCTKVLNELEDDNQEFCSSMESLLQIYGDAGRNKTDEVLWTQVPLNSFIRRIQLCNDYLNLHMRRVLGDINAESMQMENSDNTKESGQALDKLMLLKTRRVASKIEEIKSKSEEEATAAMVIHAQKILEKEDWKMFRPIQLNDEILELTKQHIVLMENIEFTQERQLPTVVQHLMESDQIKILERNVRARFERRKHRLEKLIELYSLIHNYGNNYSDLLCMLMGIQYRCLTEIAEFYADARHYFDKEYSLSSMRCKSMEKLQDDYNKFTTSFPACNSFDKLFISLVFSDQTPRESFKSALTKYNEIIERNQKTKDEIVKSDYHTEEIKLLENEINSKHEQEIRTGATKKFQPCSHAITTAQEKTINNIENTQRELTKIRNTLKNDPPTNSGLEREKTILWQRFLTDVEGLQRFYNDANKKLKNLHQQQ